jgi:hypothetical protein
MSENEAPQEHQPFKWTETRTLAAIALADGQTQRAVAEALDINEKTVSRWMQHPDFSAEVDKLTFMVGLGSRAARVRLVKRIIAQRVKDDEDVQSDKDILDWLKYLQSETQGVRLDLAAFLAASAPMARGGSTGVDAPADGRGTAGSGTAGGTDGEDGAVPGVPGEVPG